MNAKMTPARKNYQPAKISRVVHDGITKFRVSSGRQRLGIYSSESKAEYRKEEFNIRFEDCAICHEPMGDDVVNLGCTHIFHNECIVEWFSLKRSCPICRAEY